MPSRRQTVTMPDWMWDAIEDFRRGAPDEMTRTQAIHYLIEKSLEMHQIALASVLMRFRPNHRNHGAGAATGPKPRRKPQR